MSESVILFYSALVGLAVGSFLNVCIYRLPAGGSLLRPPSSCPACKRRLRWFENIPVLSYVALRGRCRSCEARISLQYPLIELATAAIWVGAAIYFDGLWPGLSAAVFGTLLLGIAVTDAREYIIPDEFSVGGLLIGLALSFAPGGPSPLMSVAGALVCFAFMYAVAVVGEWAFKKPALGGGDIKMMAMVGSFMAPRQPPSILYAFLSDLGAGFLYGAILGLLTVFVGSVVGAVIFGPIGLKTGKLVPFGIFLAVGAAIVYVWGDSLIDAYAIWSLGY
ncbi:MAG: prepilin peptidase [Gemmatimonadales bacterium]|jgi:leader peptidase (prepilin peptidase)/N-methyltransferase